MNTDLGKFAPQLCDSVCPRLRAGDDGAIFADCLLYRNIEITVLARFSERIKGFASRHMLSHSQQTVCDGDFVIK